MAAGRKRALRWRHLAWRAGVAGASFLTLSAAAPGRPGAGAAPDNDKNIYGAPFCGPNAWDWIKTAPRLVAHDSTGSCVEVPRSGQAAMKVTTAPENGSFPNISSGWQLGENSCPSGADKQPGRCFRYPVKLAADGDPVATVRGLTTPGYVGNFAFDTWFEPRAASTSFEDRCSTVLSKAGTEVMVWLSHPGDLQPASPDGYYTTLIDGHWWHVWEWVSPDHCPRGEGWRLVIFTAPRVTNGAVTVRNLKLNGFFDYAAGQGWLREKEYLMAIDLGWEMKQGGVGNSINYYSLRGLPVTKRDIRSH